MSSRTCCDIRRRDDRNTYRAEFRERIVSIGERMRRSCPLGEAQAYLDQYTIEHQCAIKDALKFWTTYARVESATFAAIETADANIIYLRTLLYGTDVYPYHFDLLAPLFAVYEDKFPTCSTLTLLDILLSYTQRPILLWGDQAVSHQ